MVPGGMCSVLGTGRSTGLGLLLPCAGVRVVRGTC